MTTCLQPTIGSSAVQFGPSILKTQNDELQLSLSQISCENDVWLYWVLLISRHPLQLSSLSSSNVTSNLIQRDNHGSSCKMTHLCHLGSSQALYTLKNISCEDKLLDHKMQSCMSLYAVSVVWHVQFYLWKTSCQASTREIHIILHLLLCYQ